jgi:hypothetical protein
MTKEQQKSEGGAVASLMKAIVGPPETGKGAASWPATLILVGLLVLFVSILGIQLALSKRKAAKLAAEVRQLEEEKTRLQEEAKLISNEEIRTAAYEAVRGYTQEILDLKARLALREKRHVDAAKGLQSITSWDDIVVVGRRAP